MTFGEILKTLREQKALTQKDMAKILGITASAYGYYEQNKRQPDFNTLKFLAEYFNVSLDYLLGYKHSFNDIINSAETKQLLEHWAKLNEIQRKMVWNMIYGIEELARGKGEELKKANEELKKSYDEKATSKIS
jgi:transcriptional regulator with XRE-family HTH domain